MSERIATIYAMLEPEVESVRYVGCTIVPVGTRLKGHLSESRRALICKNPEKNQWLAALEAKGQSPRVVVLDYAAASDRAAVEAHWIGVYLAAGEPLTNIEPKATTGRGRNVSPERERYRRDALRRTAIVRRAKALGADPSWYAIHQLLDAGHEIGTCPIADLGRIVAENLRNIARVQKPLDTTLN